MASTYTLKSHSYDGRYMYLSCTQKRNVATNTSEIAWTLTVTGGDDTYYTTGPTTVKINGTTVYYKARVAWDKRVFPAAKGSTRGTITVAHDNNGDASIPVSIKTDIYYNSPKTSSGTWTLDSNERFATIVSAPNFNDEENPTITYSNPAGNSVDLLRACISLDGTDDNVTYRDIDKTGTSYTFDLTEDERNVLRAATTSNSRIVKFYVRSEIGGSYKGSNLARTFTIKNPNPTIDPTITDSNSVTSTLTGDSSKLVRYYSNAAVTIGAAAVKQATLTSQKVTCGDKSLTVNGTINAVESNRFIFTATDSRGNTTAKTVSNPPYFVEYVKLTCVLANNMPTADGNMTVRASGNYFNGSFGAKDNSLTVYYRYRESGSSSYIEDWTAIDDSNISINGNAYSASVNLTVPDYKSAYVFEAYAVDELATVYSSERTVKATPIFDWGESDFKFNVPVYDQYTTVIRNGLAAYTGSGDSAIDPNTTLEHLCLTNINTPTSAFYYVYTSFYNSKSNTANKTQRAYPYNASSAGSYTRYMANGTWSNWVNDALASYPVGSYYISGDTTSPASLFGGTWHRIESRFLWGAPSTSTLGATAGEMTHVLTVDEMPSHTHQLNLTSTAGTSSYSTSYVAYTKTGGTTYTNANAMVATGGGAAHNNMPPYVTVAIWRRTA